MKRWTYASLLTGALLVPLACLADDNNVGLAQSDEPTPQELFPLPPIPHMDTIKWLTSGLGSARPNVLAFSTTSSQWDPLARSLLNSLEARSVDVAVSDQARRLIEQGRDER